MPGKRRSGGKGASGERQWASLHDRLDPAVWVTAGWDDPNPAAVDEDTILARLHLLNWERAGA